MEFHLATPTGDVLLFSSEDGRTVQIPVEPQGELHRQITQAKKEPVAICSGSF